jgi:multidrug efflux pump subunit AcrA (membrane-fusion protein)
MNFIGKVMTFAVLFVSIFLMVAAMFVYASHRNWKEDYDTAKKQLAEAQTLNSQLQGQKDQLESALTAERDAARQDASKLATERDQLSAQNVSLQNQLDQALQLERTNTAAVASTQANNEKLTEEVDNLRGEVRTNQAERDRAFTTTVKATDEVHQATAQLTSLRERNTQLAQEVGAKTALLDNSGIDPNSDPSAVVPRVRGVVSKTQLTGGSQLIEISIGADDGLKPSHTVEIFRGDRYLGRAEILKTEPDRAVGRIIRQFQQGQIEEGDDVATRFRIG